MENIHVDKYMAADALSTLYSSLNLKSMHEYNYKT